ncbi:hypothetical protein Cni_G03299 [Canna indica]|uniref:Uncharacterized protein n=1 Tax=Canna indica TaxID=4628 RepID=A0AAQ3JQU4_9LILI|nr:hypothetical protein Cni_G03299 [Canna indica]
MEEFSFPTVIARSHDDHLPFPKLTSTNSLWFHSPEADSSHLRRSFSQAGATVATPCRRAAAIRRPTSPTVLSDCGGDNDAERMDMLWEDFNDEINRFALDHGDRGATPKGSRRRSMGMDTLAAEAGLRAENELHGEPVGMPALAVSKSGPLRRKPGLAEMLRMLKKMFLVQKTHSSKRRSKHQN